MLSRDCIAVKLVRYRNGFGPVTPISIRISLGRNETQKELQSFAAARGISYSHKNIDLSFKLYARRARGQAGSENQNCSSARRPLPLPVAKIK